MHFFLLNNAKSSWGKKRKIETQIRLACNTSIHGLEKQQHIHMPKIRTGKLKFK